jgi:hypothetical protein
LRLTRHHYNLTTSHSWEIIAQRYAYDFVIADGALMRHRGSGEALADYLCYGQALLSPADGEVVSVRDGARVATALTKCETMPA